MNVPDQWVAVLQTTGGYSELQVFYLIASPSSYLAPKVTVCIKLGVGGWGAGHGIGH